MSTIKGRAKIQLLNRDNEVVREVVEENIITEAVERIALLTEHDFIKGLRSNPHNIYHYHAQNISPIATELFGGILLFEGPINENTKTIFPPTSAKAVGHAGAPYSGENPNRGTYNAAESGPIYSGESVIGYRHVWDFVTDRANTTIGCICLTSRLGGNTGWKSRGVSINSSSSAAFDPDSQIDTYLLSGPSIYSKTFSTANTGRGSAIAPRMTLVPPVNQTHVFYLDDTAGIFYAIDNAGSILKGTISSESELKLESTPNSVEVGSLVEVINTGAAYANYMGRRTFVHFSPTTKQFTIVRPISTSQVERKVFSESGSLLQVEVVTTTGTTIWNGNSPSVPPFYYKNKYYIPIVGEQSNQLLGEYDNTSALIRTFDLSGLGSVTSLYSIYLEALDRVIIKGRQTGFTVDTIFDGEKLDSFKTIDNVSNQMLPVESPNLGPGFYASQNESLVDGNFPSLYFKFMTNYLASINNLSAPITKTSADMMKITYDILYEN